MIFLCHVATPAIREGFLPAAQSLGREVILLTDRPEDYQTYPQRVLACDVFNPMAVLDCITQHNLPVEAVFSNSDHLQTQTAWIGQFFGVPHKSVRACYLAKNKSLMRQELARLGLESIWFRHFHSLEELKAAEQIPFPCVAKPIKGVASIDVKYLEDSRQLLEFAGTFYSKQRQPLLLEEYLPGAIYSVETLSGHLLGGFTCTLTELPYFIETGARWGVPAAGAAYVMRALEAVGATFGACHTELVMTTAGPRIIEINYRSIGDQSDFMLDNLSGGSYFQNVLRTALGETIQPPVIDAELHSVAHYLFAERAGQLSQAPDGFVTEREGCAVHYVPTKKARDVVDLTHSNKDYLGMLHVTGPGRQRVEELLERELQSLRAGFQWA
ncbi:MAG: siderophore biosynthesis protein [Candidatus Eremiobacteraeota bacterium]|nr:siderophore biosynthesis protein [Candidatus Eremiobacteraeota bacterium]MCW5871960.1 siderophore biosynthesis protein [Candidatus Eremiobacteraeota bacterium]